MACSSAARRQYMGKWRIGFVCVFTAGASPSPRGKILHTRNHKSEIPLENASENRLDFSSENPLGE